MRATKNIIIGGLLLAAWGTAFAEEQDHARWFVQDATPQARYQTMKNEAHGGYRETLAMCRSMQRGERNACEKEARENFRVDMANAKAVLAR